MEDVTLVKPLEDYSDILREHGLEYKPSGYYWQVGDIAQTQGWILHLSVNNDKVWQLAELVVPFLAHQKISFRIIRDLFVAGKFMDGGLGYINVGKLMSIYPKDDPEANKLAKELISLTQSFRGAAIPTDRHLGGIVYTRYGSCNPVWVTNSQGEQIKHIYDSNGQLIPDPYNIPFLLPDGISWPFGDFITPYPPARRKLLNYAYYPLFTMKADVKGSVIKALYFKKFWKILPCLIKQGRANMFEDEAGRDIKDRLKWQYDLYQALKDDIPMPEVFDYFHEYDDTYLAMAFIKGLSLRDWVNEIYQGGNWFDLSKKAKLTLIDRFLEILTIIQRLHEKGYVHRDITSANFLLDRSKKIWLIDMELAYSITKQTPDPPFKLGTPGFMSPEQQAWQQFPTVKEDIYGLGALAVDFFTNLYPDKIDQYFPGALYKTMLFFTGKSEIATKVAAFQAFDPTERPVLTDLQKTMKEWKENIMADKDIKDGDSAIQTPPSPILVREIVQAGLKGLVYPGLMCDATGWISMKKRTESHIGNQQFDVCFYPGWHTGMAGSLWLIGMAQKAGFDVKDTLEICNAAVEYIKEQYNKNGFQTSRSLYNGGPGIALALVAGLESGILCEDSEILSIIEAAFAEMPAGLSLSTGIAGYGLSLLKCQRWLDHSFAQLNLNNSVEIILQAQQEDGSWPSLDDAGKRKGHIYLGLDEGVAGIVLFLLAFLEKTSQDKVKTAVEKALQWLMKNSKKKKQRLSWPVSTKNGNIDHWGISYGTPGITLVFIRAFKIFKNAQYKLVAENALIGLPTHPITMDFTIDGGLAGLGEIYQEAAEVFEQDKWLFRSEWITGLFCNTFKRLDETSGYWIPIVESSTADLFAGNSGIVHFLIRQNTLNSIPGILS